MLIGKYRLFRILGNGSSSTVKLGYHIITSLPVAVKIILKTSLEDNWTKNDFLSKVQIMKELDHPGIIKVLDFLEDESSFYIVMEYCGGGELFDFIISRKRVEEILAKRLFKQIVLSVQYIHSKDIVHRDLKPENILLNESNSIKIIDFGLCSKHCDELLYDRCGSSCYFSPESLISSSYYGKPADIWALGVILYALVDGSLPWNYKDSSRMFEQITKGDFPMPKSLSFQCQDLIKRILVPDPNQRITIESILIHPWLFGVGNVFPTTKSLEITEQRLNLSLGGFSAGDVKSQLGLSPRLPPIETFYPEGFKFQSNNFDNNYSPIQKSPQPRSISLNSVNINQFSDENSNNIIFSKTISHHNPEIVAQMVENILLQLGIQFKKTNSLLFNVTQNSLSIIIEICRLYGFKNIYIISFSKVLGENWDYTNFVSNILKMLK